MIYIHARTKNIQLEFGLIIIQTLSCHEQRLCRTRMALPPIRITYKKELNDYPEELFIKNNQNFESHIYSFGAMPKDLYKVNDEVKDERINLSSKS